MAWLVIKVTWNWFENEMLLWMNGIWCWYG